MFSFRFAGERADAARTGWTKMISAELEPLNLKSGELVAVKAEARYHLIANRGDLNPDGLAVTIGLKKYF